MIHIHPSQFEELTGERLLLEAYTLYGRRFAVVSSFGPESAALLRLVARVDPAMRVLFIDTGMHFPKTLEYKALLTDRLKLTNVISIGPSEADVEELDPRRKLHRKDDQACCDFRKVRPLREALTHYDGWANGRKRYQGGERKDIPAAEHDGELIKFNPLATWSEAEIERTFTKHGLPRHPLAGAHKRILCNGFCSKDRKLECGIHTRRKRT